MVCDGTVRSWNRAVRFLFGVLFVFGFVAGPLLAPSAARAQGVDADVESLVDEASNHYDNLEIEAAREKLKEAIKIGQERGGSDEVVAKAYVMVGVVEYGAKREKERALKAFKEAAKLDADASIPEVYKTPTLGKLMKKAKEQTGAGDAQKDSESGDRRDVDEFTHEPISSAQAGEPLVVEAFVPTDLSAESVEFVFQRYDQEDEWQRVELEATNATRFAKEVPGYRIYTTQISYYIVVENPAGEIVARSGSKDSPNNITVLGNAGFDPEQAKKEYLAQKREEEEETEEPDEQPSEEEEQKPEVEEPEEPKTDVGEEPPEQASASGYFDFGGGTGVGFLTGGGSLSPTANPTRSIQPGLSSAFAHLRLGGGYMFGSGAQLGLYFRFQFLPAQNFTQIRDSLDSREYRGFRNGPCLGTGLPGDCLLGAKYRWFFSDANPTQFFSSVGAGFGRVRHWLRLREPAEDGGTGFCENQNKPIYQDQNGQDYCFRSDTARPGWAHFGVGAGLNYKFSDTASLLAEGYFQILFPNTAVNLDINVGPQFRF